MHTGAAVRGRRPLGLVGKGPIGWCGCEWRGGPACRGGAAVGGGAVTGTGASRRTCRSNRNRHRVAAYEVGPHGELIATEALARMVALHKPCALALL